MGQPSSLKLPFAGTLRASDLLPAIKVPSFRLSAHRCRRLACARRAIPLGSPASPALPFPTDAGLLTGPPVLRGSMIAQGGIALQA